MKPATTTDCNELRQIEHQIEELKEKLATLRARARTLRRKGAYVY